MTHIDLDELERDVARGIITNTGVSLALIRAVRAAREFASVAHLIPVDISGRFNAMRDALLPFTPREGT